MTHSLDLIQVNYKALVFTMVSLDALTAENSFVTRAIEVLYSFWMLLTQFLVESLFIFVFKIKVFFLQDLILLHNFKEYVDVQRKSLSAF